MAQSSIGHVFMSYSRTDEEVMRRITTFLRKQGMQVWVDNENLIPGTPIWEEEIEKAINGAFAIVAVLSADAKGSEWVRREITYADQYEKRVFPVLVGGDEDSSIPIRLITRQFVDIRSNEEVGLNSLSAAIAFYAEGIDARERKAREEAEKLARAQAEREAAERESARLRTERETAELVAHVAAEKAAREKAEEEATREKAAREKVAREQAEREKKEREVIKKLTDEAKEKENRARAEKRRQKYLELRNKTTHAIKLYYRHILLFSIAITFIVLASMLARSLLPVSTSIPPPTATSPLGSLLSSPPASTKTRAPIPTNTPYTLPIELIISFEKNGIKKGLSLDIGGDVDTEIVTIGFPQSQARRTGACKPLLSLDNTTGDCYMQFKIDDRIMYDGTPTTFVLIQFEYFDQGKDDFNVNYDAMGNAGPYKNGKFTNTCKITKGNTLVFKKATFAIKDARFANQDNGADFRISDYGDGAEIIRLVRVLLLSSLDAFTYDSCGIVK